MTNNNGNPDPTIVILMGYNTVTIVQV